MQINYPAWQDILKNLFIYFVTNHALKCRYTLNDFVCGSEFYLFPNKTGILSNLKYFT